MRKQTVLHSYIERRDACRICGRRTRCLACLLILFAVGGCKKYDTAAQATQVVEVTDATFQAEVLNSKMPVIVELWAPWCQPCLDMQPDLERFASEHRSQVKVARIRIDQNPKSATAYRVDSPPCILVFVDGQIAKMRKGRQSIEELEAIVPD